MHAPNADTLERYKNNLLGGHLLEKGCEADRDYWMNISDSCDRDCDGKLDAKHLQELAKIEYIEAVIGVCRLGIMQQQLNASTPEKKNLFSVSKKHIVAAGILALASGLTYMAMSKPGATAA